MKKTFRLIVVLIFTALPFVLFGQLASTYKLTNFNQVDETTLEFDLELHNTGTQAFGLDAAQVKILLNQSMFKALSPNGASALKCVSSDLVGAYGGDGVNQPTLAQQITVTLNNGFLVFVTNILPPVWPVIDLFEPGTFKKLATIRLSFITFSPPATYKKQPFAEIANSIAFDPLAGHHTVLRANVYDASFAPVVYENTDVSPTYVAMPQPLRVGLPSTNSILAGYCFTGTGNFSTTTLWNNATHSTITGYHVVPSPTNSAIINGVCILDQSVTINNLYVKPGAVLTIPSGYTLTIDGVLENAGTINVPINLEPNGGNAVTSISGAYGSTIATLPTATKSGYALAGWFTDAALTNEFIANSTIVSFNMTLYAKWNVATPTAFTVNGSGSYCQGTGGTPVGLLSSESGVNYQLYKDASPLGTPVAGTGSAIDFGNQMAGTYTIDGTNTITLASTTMTGSAVISENPLINVSVSIAENANNVCAGTSVTFTATPTNGGTTPTYQWYNGAAEVGTNSTTYTYAPENGDVITVQMVSNATSCLVGSPATSNPVTMMVNPVIITSVTINASSNPIQNEVPVTFTPTPVNGGTIPTYEWFKNSVSVTTSDTYTYVPLDGDQVYAIMTSNDSPCVNLATSNTITMSVSIETGTIDNDNVSINIHSFDKSIFVQCSEKVDQIKIYNAVGSLIKIVDNSSDMNKISMIGNPEGCYIISLISNMNVYSGKVILK